MSPLPTAGQLARIRGVVEAHLPEVCTIHRPSGARTAGGWPSGVQTLIAEDVPCRTAPVPVRGSETLQVEGATSNPPWQIVLPASTPTVKPQDTITVDERVYEVTTPDSGRSIAGCVVVRCVLVDSP